MHKLFSAARRHLRITIGASLGVIAVASFSAVMVAHAAHATATTATPSPTAAPTLNLGNGHAPAKHHSATPGMGVGDLIKMEAKVTGLSVTAIQADLQSGQTLAAIAGTNEQAVISAATTAVSTKIAAAVTAGTITEAQGQTLQTTIMGKVTTLMTTPGTQVLAMGHNHAKGASPSPSPSPAGA